MSVHAINESSKKKSRETGSLVKSVSVISTGTGEGHWEHIHGSRKPALWWIFFGKRWVKLPLNVFVIEHSNGLVLFDTGQDRAVMTDPDYWPAGFTGTIMRHLFKFHIGPDETLIRQLEKLGYSTDDVSKAVFSHLHSDHTGSIGEILHADLIVSHEAWEHMLRPHSEREMILRRDIELPGAKWQQIDFKPADDPLLAPFEYAYDLMGDGSMVLLPTPGHGVGSISMLVRRDSAPPLLLIADLTYRTEFLERFQFPGTGDKKKLRASFEKVLALKKRMPDLVIIASHDPGAAEALSRF